MHKKTKLKSNFIQIFITLVEKEKLVFWGLYLCFLCSKIIASSTHQSVLFEILCLIIITEISGIKFYE